MQSLSVPIVPSEATRGTQAAGGSSPIIFSQGKKQMVNSTEKNFFLELILIKDVLEALTESWGNQSPPRVRGGGLRRWR